MKRLAVVGMSGVMAVVLASCFALSGFIIVDSSLSPGQSTIARFTVRPYAPGTDKFFQFFLIGTTSPENIAVSKGTWGANGTFGGPEALNVQGLLAAALDGSGDCVVAGFDFSSVYGSFTWKGFATDRRVGGGPVNKTSTTEVKVKAKAAAASDTAVAVVAVTGAWDDDGDGVPESTDAYYCTGNAGTNIYVT